MVAVQLVGIGRITFGGGCPGGHLCSSAPGHLWKLMLDDLICSLRVVMYIKSGHRHCTLSLPALLLSQSPLSWITCGASLRSGGCNPSKIARLPSKAPDLSTDNYVRAKRWLSWLFSVCKIDGGSAAHSGHHWRLYKTILLLTLERHNNRTVDE